MTDERNPERPEPPGDFVSDDLRAQTAQFLEELRKRIEREKAEPEPKLGPPQK
jgi:hypothetical protein